MANEGNLVTRSAVAAADLSAAQFKFVAHTSADKVQTVSTAGVNCYGVLQNDPEAAQLATVAVSGLTKVWAGAALVVGDEVSIDSSGRAVATTMGFSIGRVRRAAGAAAEIAVIELYPAPKAVFPLSLGTARTATLSGTDTLTAASLLFQRLDPGGSSRDVNLPAEEVSVGRVFRILNMADAAENLVVKSDAPATIVTLNQNEACWVSCDGTTWTHMGVETIALT
jgi:hypothetical protein